MSVLPANAVIVFSQPTASEDPLFTGFGDYGPVTEANPLIVVAFLKPLGAPTANPEVAGNRATTQVQGYLISPSLMPSEIQPQQTGRCAFWRVGMGDGFVLPTSFADLAAYDAFVLANAAKMANVGTFTVDANIPGPFGVEAILGDRLNGTFTAETSWTDEL